MKLKSLLLAALLFIAGSNAFATDYGTAPDLIAKTPARSRYFTWEGEVTPDEFLEQADRHVPVVLHMHGCGGIHPWSDMSFVTMVRQNHMNVVAPDFLARGDAQTSCPSGRAEPGGHPETSNPARIAARRLEMEQMIGWLKAQGFTQVWVSGHSEGGRVVQGVKADVRGVLVLGMDCKVERLQFWQPNPRNRVHVFVSRRDPWLDWPRATIRGCGGIADSTTMHWTDVESHEPLSDPAWRGQIVQLLKPAAPQ